MTLRKKFKLWLLVLLEISVAAVAVAIEELWILMLVGPILVASWYLGEGHLRILLDRRLVNVGACLSLLVVLLSAFSDPDPGRGMTLLASFVLALIVLRQMQERTSREDAQQIVLSAVLMIASTMQTTLLLFGILLVCWTGVMVYVVILFQLYSGTERARRSRLEGETNQSIIPPLSIRFGKREIASIRLVAFFSFLAIITLSVIVFIFFPRQLLFKSGLPGQSAVARSEFVQAVDLITNARVNNSNREVFSLEWISPDGQPMKWTKPILMRGAVLDSYDPELDRWIASPGRRGARRVTHFEVPADGFIQIGIKPISEQFSTYTLNVEMRSMASDVLFAPWVPVAIASAAGRQFELDRRTMIITESMGSTIGSYSSYELRVQPFPQPSTVMSLVGNADPPDTVTSFPVPEVRQLALNALTEMGESPEPELGEGRWERNKRVSEALESWLEVNCAYTVDLGEFIQVSGEDPIVSFIDRYRFGHCEYFASALTGMCRSLGIESRLVTGYVAIEFDDRSRTYIVRDSNAHAWTEVRTGQYQWQTLDPSPLAALDEIRMANRSWLDRWRRIFDRLDFFWNSTFVAFDQRSQNKIRSSLTDGWSGMASDWSDWIRERLGSVNRFFRFGVAGYIWMGSILVIILSFVIVFTARAKRRNRDLAAFGIGASEARVMKRLVASLAFWSEALQSMSRRGVEKHSNETPLEFARRTSAIDPIAGSTLSSLARAMYRIRFGGIEPDEEELKMLLSQARTLRVPGSTR